MELRGKVSMLSRTSKLLLVVALVAGSLAIAAPAANAVPTKTVKAANSPPRWKPGTAHLFRQGGKGIIKWKNPTRKGHNVKSINVGAKWKMTAKQLRTRNRNTVKRTFKRPGTFWFRCTFDSAKVGGKWQGMVGKIRVH